MSKRSELAKIHIAKKELGMADDAYRAMLKDVAGVQSASELDFHGRHAVLHRLEKLGWKPSRKKYGPKTRAPKKAKVYLVDGKWEDMELSRASQGDKIRALWLAMHNQRIIKNGSEVALRAYIKRMTKGQYDAPQFCDSFTANSIIEGLKKWQARELAKRDSEE